MARPTVLLAAAAALLASVGLGCRSDRCLSTRDCGDGLRCRGGQCLPPAGPPPDDGSVDADLPDAPEVDADDDSTTVTRPVLAFAVSEVLSTPICDLDGDGTPENALQPLGVLDLEFIAPMFQEILASASTVLILDLSELEDPATPHDLELTCPLFVAQDCDENPDNNDQPGQVLGARNVYFDASGQCVNRPDCSVASGRLVGSGDRVTFYEESLETSVTWLRPRFEGILQPGATAFEGTLCGILLARDLARVPFRAAPGLSVLDALNVADLQPNVDLDGDGLERFYRVAAIQIDRCYDGDGSEIESTPEERCTEREEVADGFSLAIRIVGVSAELIPPPHGQSCPGF